MMMVITGDDDDDDDDDDYDDDDDGDDDEDDDEDGVSGSDDLRQELASRQRQMVDHLSAASAGEGGGHAPPSACNGELHETGARHRDAQIAGSSHGSGSELLVFIFTTRSAGAAATVGASNAAIADDGGAYVKGSRSDVTTSPEPGIIRCEVAAGAQFCRQDGHDWSHLAYRA